jgi:hypothetical protein
VAAPVALGRVRAHPKWARLVPFWLAASNDQLRLVTVGASLKLKNLAPNLIFHKTFIIFWVFINIFKI